MVAERAVLRYSAAMRGLLILLLMLASPAAAEPPSRGDLERVQQDLERTRQESAAKAKRAATLEREMDSLTKALIAAAARERDLEQDVLHVQDRIKALDQDVSDAQAVLRTRAEDSMAVIMALQRLALLPREALLAQPGALEDAIRAAITMGGLVPALEQRAERLRLDLVRLREARLALGRERSVREEALVALQIERTNTARLLDRKRTARAETAAEAERLDAKAKALAEEASSMRDLLAKLQRKAKDEAARLAKLPPRPPTRDGQPQAASPPTVQPPNGGAFKLAKGRLPVPVSGRVAKPYGAALSSGGRARGITFEAMDDAQVVSPYDGVVQYAGVFRHYGQILIIAHGDGYHSLLAGLGTLHGAVGQTVLAGEPVGRMGAGDGALGPMLYMELRQSGDPINPAPWLSARTQRDRGS